MTWPNVLIITMKTLKMRIWCHKHSDEISRKPMFIKVFFAMNSSMRWCDINSLWRYYCSTFRTSLTLTSREPSMMTTPATFEQFYTLPYIPVSHQVPENPAWQSHRKSASRSTHVPPLRHCLVLQSSRSAIHPKRNDNVKKLLCRRIIESSTSIGSRVTYLGLGWYDVTNLRRDVAAETGMWHRITRDRDLSLWNRY